MQPASYDLFEFLEACRLGTGVVFWEKAEDGAFDLFGLDSKQKILNALVSSEVENRRLLEAERLRLPPRGKLVDAYDFDLWGEKVYLAFYQEARGWTLKSFHRQQPPIPTFPMHEQKKRIEAGLNDYQK